MQFYSLHDRATLRSGSLRQQHDGCTQASLGLAQRFASNITGFALTGALPVRISIIYRRKKIGNRSDVGTRPAVVCLTGSQNRPEKWLKSERETETESVVCVCGGGGGGGGGQW